jgi:antirestriction protein
MTEERTQVVPRIYVASLSDYNAGRLHGAWIDATQSADEIGEAVQAMLTASREPGAEEWAIHDHEGFQGIRLSEWETFERVAELAEMLTEHGAAYGAYVGITDDAEVSPDNFRDRYQGHHDSAAAFAEEWACEHACLIDDEHPMFSFIDWEHYARELDCEGFHFVDAGAPEYGVYVFLS